jgi:LPXTG-motif cell wall-anchored protein
MVIANGAEAEDAGFGLNYEIGSGNGPFKPVNAGLSEEDKTRYQLTKTANGKITTFTTGKALPSIDDKGRHYIYYVVETEAGPGSFTTYYGTVDEGSVTRHEDYQHARDGQAIINLESSGVELPLTGGIGTTIFYILGSILVLGGAVVLISRRRMI